MKIYREKMITGASVVLLSVIMHYLAFSQIQDASLAGVSPRAVPYLVARIVLILGFVMIAQAITLYVKERGEKAFSSGEKKFSRFPFYLFALMLLYALMMYALGYFIASFTVLPLMMFVLKERKPKNYAILAGLIIFVFVVIDVLLKIGLPKIGLFGII